MQALADSQEISLTIRRGILDNRKRQLIINRDYIQFEDKDLVNDAFTKFNKEEIADYRYGINWITGYWFTIGREYQIFVRNRDKQTIKISFKCLYGVRKNELHEMYSDIVNALWDFYFVHIIKNHRERINNGERVIIEDVHIQKEGIRIKADRFLSNKAKLIPWEDVGSTNYRTYFAIYSKTDSNFNRGFSYLKDWNTGILYSVVRGILIDKHLIEA